SPNGKLLVSAGENNTLKLWDAATGKEVNTLKGHLNGNLLKVAFSHDGKLLASGCWMGGRGAPLELKLWDVDKGQEIRDLKGHLGGVTGVAFSPDSKILVSAGGDQTLKVWDVVTGKEMRTLKGHTRLAGVYAGLVRSVSFHPDGKRVASVSTDKT